jgi:hypothetical protein
MARHWQYGSWYDMLDASMLTEVHVCCVLHTDTHVFNDDVHT